MSEDTPDPPWTLDLSLGSEGTCSATLDTDVADGTEEGTSIMNERSRTRPSPMGAHLRRLVAGLDIPEEARRERVLILEPRAGTSPAFHESCAIETGGVRSLTGPP